MKKLIIGLGNPGPEFRATPHNFGFQFLDQLQKFTKAPFFQGDSALKAQLTETEIKGVTIILAKPLTFMNKSGEAARLLKEKFGIDLEDIWVIHDDLDIPFGEFKIVCNRGSAGHKGVASIIQSLSSQNFCRLRLGAKFSNPTLNRQDFVLRKISFSQRLALRKTIRQTIPIFIQQLKIKRKQP